MMTSRPLRVGLFLGWAFGLLVVSLAYPAAAELRLHSTWTDHAVVQRGQPIVVQGVAKAGERVEVELAGDRGQVVADRDGWWRLELPARQPSTRKLSLTVTSGGESVKVNHIRVGDVWLIAGQSNMNYRVRFSPTATAWAKRIGSQPEIRMMFMEQKPADTPRRDQREAFPYKWRIASSRLTHDFSAVGLSFAYHLREHEEVPIGLIHATHGGTAIECWLPRGDLERLGINPDLKFRGKRPYTGYYNAMIAPLRGLPFRGVAWYQGESNTHDARNYAEKMKTLIRRYREDLTGDEVPFVLVQLPSYGKDHGEAHGGAWAWVRDGQAAARDLPSVEMAVTYDLGEFEDIHPPQKVEIGRRLAEAARLALKDPDARLGPMFSASRFGNAEVQVTFDVASGPLEARRVVMNKRSKQPPLRDAEAYVSKAGVVEGFWLAGRDRVFHPAEGEIAGNRVTLRSEKVREPMAARYAWSDFTKANLFDAAGRPAEPFRTDDWPMER